MASKLIGMALILALSLWSLTGLAGIPPQLSQIDSIVSVAPAFADVEGDPDGYGRNEVEGDPDGYSADEDDAEESEGEGQPRSATLALEGIAQALMDTASLLLSGFRGLSF